MGRTKLDRVIMPEPIEDYCERSGEHRLGVRKLMFYSTLARFPKLPIAREFICFSCIRSMKINTIVGFTLLVIVVGSIVGVTMWLNSSASMP